MGELLLELLSEEIPARMQRRAIEDLVRHLSEWLQAHRISPAKQISGYVTPRRLTVIGAGIPEQLPRQQEERRGPRVGAPQQALDGFLRSVGLTSIDECEVRDTDRGELYFATIERLGRPTAEVLPDLIYSAILDVAWPKSMRYPASPLRWVRPLNSVVCLFDGDIVDLPLGDVPVGRTTRGHRFLSEGDIAVDSADDYLAKLAAAHVILDHDRRRELIQKDLGRLAKAEGLKVKDDPGLLDEVAGLVEYPVVLIGGIDDASMALPPEVLATAMRTHQKYFSCLKKDGSPAPRFLFVANNLTPDHGKTIVAGNERVLRARLADARFFWEQDKKVRLEDRVEALKQRVYHDKLGDMRDRADRVERLSVFLKPYVPGDSPVALARRGARLAKADLSTAMVGEFPELQGVMGRYYALHDGEDPRVADAIAEHYKPLGPNDGCPTAPVSVVVALADKIITLMGFFGVAEKPTGSRDPYALRRAALGVIRLIIENNLRIPLRATLGKAKGLWDPKWLTNWDPNFPEPTDELLAFIADRLKVHLRGGGFGVIGGIKLYGLRHDLISAVFALDEDDLVRLMARAGELAAFLATEDGADLLVAYRRAANIVAIEERKGGWTPGAPDLTRRREPEEFALTERLAQTEARLQAALLHEDFVEAMTALATLRQPVDEFFDKVTVNTDDPALRENRLRLLSRIRAVMNQVADFSQIEG